jgi:hypothetical protein
MTRIATSTGPLFLAALLGVAAWGTACGGGDHGAAAARASEWAAIERERGALVELRAELAAAREQRTPQAQELEAKVGTTTDRFLERLVAFINQHAGAGKGNGGAEAAPELEQAIRLKSAEDLLLAREYIERGGDYAKAIDILAAARVVDPGNPELEAAQAEAARLRYMDEERFGRIEKGMTEDQVRAELGQVQPQNVRRPADGQVIWLYPKEGGAAAAVFFRAGRDGALEVDDINFEAVPSAAERAVAVEERGEPTAD